MVLIHGGSFVGGDKQGPEQEFVRPGFVELSTRGHCWRKKRVFESALFFLFIYADVRNSYDGMH